MNIDWSKAPEGATHRDAGGNWLKKDQEHWMAWCSSSQGYWFTVGLHNLQVPLIERKEQCRPPKINITKKMAILEAALRSCVSVMDQDLNGLAVIQPELSQAKQALEDIYLADDEFEPWNGEGLPPVGTVCEYERGRQWVKVEVFAVKPNCNGSSSALFTYEDGSWNACANLSNFRPIRTPEQIAAEERKAAVNELRSDMEDEGVFIDQRMAEIIHDAGYRKQVQP